MFVNQSLLSHNRYFDDETDKDELRGKAVVFLMWAIIGFALCSVLVVLIAIYENNPILDIKYVIKIFAYITFGFAVIPIYSAIRAQKTFKLRAGI